MNRIPLKLLILILVGLAPVAQAQILTPATWEIELSKTDLKAGDEIDIIFKATIDDKWYLYANDFDPDCGPLVTEVKFSNTKNFQLAEGLKAINSIPKHDEIFDCDVKIFKKKGEFRQRIRVLGSPLSIEGSIEGQVCTEIEGKCVNFATDFSFANLTVSGSPQAQAEPPAKQGASNEQSANRKITPDGRIVPDSVTNDQGR
jgi:thiol:disulfide interchange protein DsbD